MGVLGEHGPPGAAASALAMRDISAGDSSALCIIDAPGESIGWPSVGGESGERGVGEAGVTKAPAHRDDDPTHEAPGEVCIDAYCDELIDVGAVVSAETINDDAST